MDLRDLTPKERVTYARIIAEAYGADLVCLRRCESSAYVDGVVIRKGESLGSLMTFFENEVRLVRHCLTKRNRTEFAVRSVSGRTPTCFHDRCRHKADTCVSWRSERMPASAFWYFCSDHVPDEAIRQMVEA